MRVLYFQPGNTAEVCCLEENIAHSRYLALKTALGAAGTRFQNLLISFLASAKYVFI